MAIKQIKFYKKTYCSGRTPWALQFLFSTILMTSVLWPSFRISTYLHTGRNKSRSTQFLTCDMWVEYVLKYRHSRLAPGPLEPRGRRGNVDQILSKTCPSKDLALLLASIPPSGLISTIKNKTKTSYLQWSLILYPAYQDIFRPRKS